MRYMKVRSLNRRARSLAAWLLLLACCAAQEPRRDVEPIDPASDDEVFVGWSPKLPQATMRLLQGFRVSSGRSGSSGWYVFVRGMNEERTFGLLAANRDVLEREQFTTAGTVPGDAPFLSRYQGRVVGEEGEPISGARVTALMTGGTSNRVRTGSVRTDAGGLFRFTGLGLNPHVLVEADAFAYAKFRLDSKERAVLRLFRGSRVSGRVLRGGVPVEGVEVRLTRWTGKWRWEDELDAGNGPEPRSMVAVTDCEGRYRFPHVPPKEDHYVAFLTLATMLRSGTAELVFGAFRDEESAIDLPDVALRSGLAMAGRVVVAGGDGLPAGAYIVLERGLIRDGLRIPLDDDGRFELRGLPPDIYALAVRAPGFRLSARNQSLHPTGHDELRGRLMSDVSDLLVELERGDPESRLGPHATVMLPDGSDANWFEGPLRGIPAK